ncbi:hypothetical protein TeGR_g791 [Tetraparma gracilis]|uniref:Uncharacterized protein n=1 Tax=Tetraparma gracilis TaxID=2962635 RepID=A0ABQ6MK33_9STRA|nr:hypothetical protein TeGR_g791 [Tetraparma gracilis]
MPAQKNSGIKISKDKELKAVVNYFNKPPRDLKAEAAARAKKEREETAAAEASAAAAAEALAQRRAQEEALAAAEAERNKKVKVHDILDDFDDKDFVIPTEKLSDAKMRDYGYGVPQWSPYRVTKVTSTPEWKNKLWSTTNSEWGSYSKIKSALDPKTQTRLAKGLVKEMKANACMDHTWEIIGERPGQGENGKPKFFMP